jgi:D-methionine transport system substrate-binding protein
MRNNRSISPVFFLITIFINLLFLLPSCVDSKKSDPNYIKVGVEAGPEYIIAQKVQEIAKQKYGLTVELVQFNDYIMPNTALDQGDLDANAFQTKAFLDEQTKLRGYHFSIVGKTFIYPMAAYSKKIRSIDELQEGATIAIPNEVSNGSRALLLLEKVGLIKLKENIKIPQVVDIIRNDKKIKIVELEAAQLPRVLDDKQITFAIINNNFAAQAGLLLKDGIFAEGKDSPYVNLIVSREENKNDDKIKKFVQAYQTDEVLAVAEREFKGGAIKGW